MGIGDWGLVSGCDPQGNYALKQNFLTKTKTMYIWESSKD